MKLRIVIPVRTPEEGKSRLRPALGAIARAALVEQMFCHVLRVATTTTLPARCHVVSHSPLLLGLATATGAQSISETGYGLNAALSQAARAICLPGPLLALSADLPLIKKADIVAMTDALAEADVVAATDRAGQGTNALLLREPLLIDYCFGEDSLARHRAQTKSRGLRFVVIRRSGLASDLDHPADLALLDQSLL